MRGVDLDELFVNLFRLLLHVRQFGGIKRRRGGRENTEGQRNEVLTVRHIDLPTNSRSRIRPTLDAQRNAQSDDQQQRADVSIPLDMSVTQHETADGRAE